MKIKFSRGTNEQGPWWGIEEIADEGEVLSDSSEITNLAMVMALSPTPLFWMTSAPATIEAEMRLLSVVKVNIEDEELIFDLESTPGEA